MKGWCIDVFHLKIQPMKFTLSKSQPVHLSFDGNIQVEAVNNSTQVITLTYAVAYNKSTYRLQCDVSESGLVTFTESDAYNDLVEAIRVCNLESKPNSREAYFGIDFLKSHTVSEVKYALKSNKGLLDRIHMSQNAAAALAALATGSVSERKVRSL